MPGLCRPYLFPIHCLSSLINFADVMSKQEFLKMGGRFTFSDDSHATDQIGLNFGKVLDFMVATGIQEVYCLTSGHNNDFEAATKTARKVSVAELKSHPFFTSGTSRS